MLPARFALVKIPAHLNFDDLHLSVDPESDMLEFDCAPLREILEVNTDLTLKYEEEILELIAAWYGFLRLSGYRHEIAEEYLAHCETLYALDIARLLASPDAIH